MHDIRWPRPGTPPGHRTPSPNTPWKANNSALPTPQLLVCHSLRAVISSVCVCVYRPTLVTLSINTMGTRYFPSNSGAVSATGGSFCLEGTHEQENALSQAVGPRPPAAEEIAIHSVSSTETGRQPKAEAAVWH